MPATIDGMLVDFELIKKAQKGDAQPKSVICVSKADFRTLPG
jgi:hypothetical protein